MCEIESAMNSHVSPFVYSEQSREWRAGARSLSAAHYRISDRDCGRLIATSKRQWWRILNHFRRVKRGRALHLVSCGVEPIKGAQMTRRDLHARPLRSARLSQRYPHVFRALRKRVASSVRPSGPVNMSSKRCVSVKNGNSIQWVADECAAEKLERSTARASLHAAHVQYVLVLSAGGRLYTAPESAFRSKAPEFSF